MNTIGTPLAIPELELKPEPTGGIQLSEDMQQVLALLTAFWRNKRVLLKASPSGILFVSSPQIKDIYHITGVGVNYTKQGDNVECTEVLVMGHPNNASIVWVKPHATATSNNAWPLAKGEVLGLSITNLNMLNLLIIFDGDKVIVAYTE